jgi:hypothetical protein
MGEKLSSYFLRISKLRMLIVFTSFRDCLSVPSARVKQPEENTFDKIYRMTLRENPEEHKRHLHQGGILKPCKKKFTSHLMRLFQKPAQKMEL